MNRLLIYPLIFIINMVWSNPSLANDSLVTTIQRFENDSLRFEWLRTQINQKIFSEDSAVAVLIELYDSLAQINPIEIYKARALNFKGMKQYVDGDFERAAEIYLKAIEILERNQNNQKDLVQILNNLAACYSFRKDKTKSIEYYEQSLEYAKVLNDTTQLAQIYSNLGRVGTEAKLYDKSRRYYDQAIYLYQILGNQIYEGISTLGRGILFTNVGQHMSAIKDYQKAMSLVDETIVPLLHASALAGIGTSYNGLEQFKTAESFLLKSLEKAREINHIEQLKESHIALSEVYENLGQFEKSLYHHKEYSLAKDSLLTESQDEALMDAITKYEAEKKEKEIATLNFQNEIAQLKLQSSNRRNLGLGLLSIGFLSFASILFYLNRRINRQKDIISTALKEKNILLKEIHHRVKNNLQVVSSLLNLQSKYVEDHNAQIALKEGQNRVKAMAIIHQKLYQGTQLTSIEMSDYMPRLIAYLFDSYNIDKERIELVTKIEPLHLDVDTVIPMGLIINELISNSLKHGFPGSARGRIIVELKEELDTLVLKVIDDGIGMQIEKEKDSIPNFGSQLVHAFADQLDADLMIRSEEGTQVTISIKDYKKVA